MVFVVFDAEVLLHAWMGEEFRRGCVLCRCRAAVAVCVIDVDVVDMPVYAAGVSVTP